jgi:TM2 domain-containing membrane protein YozV
MVRNVEGKKLNNCHMCVIQTKVIAGQYMKTSLKYMCFFKIFICLKIHQFYISQ